MARQPIEFTDYHQFPAEPAGQAGITRRIISQSEDGRSVACIVEYRPGVETNRGVTRHDHWEHVFILEGSMYDITLQQTFKKGSVACRPPQMPHGPWRIPEGGCVLYEVAYDSDED